MQKLLKNLFLILYPFYPLWAWVTNVIIKKPIEPVVNIIFLPLALYYIIVVNKKLPKYLVFLIIFTIYHLVSVYLNNVIPKDTNWVYFILSDPNVLACAIFVVIENTDFDKEFIARMNKRMVLIVIISFAVSLVQIKNPEFFFNTNTDQDLFYVGENRNFSIYSWVNLNSAGITFPILIAILISVYKNNKLISPVVIACGIAVSFLTRARFVMISIVVALSQLFLSTKRSLIKRAAVVFALVFSVFSIWVIAEKLGFDVNEVINNRILEKDSDMESAKSRVLSYEVFLTVFPEHPFIGVGPETREDVVTMLGGEAPLIHVGYLSYLYFYGIAGCFFIFFALYQLLKDAWVVGKKHSFWGSFYGLISFCLANWTFVYFNFTEMGIVLAIIYIRHYKSEVSFSSDISNSNSNEIPFLITDETLSLKNV